MTASAGEGDDPVSTIRPLEGWEEMAECVRLQEETWGPDFTERVPATLLRLVQRLGGVVSGAFDRSGHMLGFVFGMPAIVHGELVHWSDMLAVRAGFRDRGIGEALKWHQREQLLAAGFTRACWTFDPLEARNAHVNFARLGVVAREYIRDFYGEGASPLHRGIATDRLVAVWDIAGERVARRVARADRSPTAPEIAGLPVIISSTTSPAEWSAGPQLDLAEPLLRLGIPPRIQAMKRAQPELAREWRRRSRVAFEEYVGRGYEVTEFVRDGDSGWYVLARV